MGFNKLGAAANLQPALPISLGAGEVLMLPAGQGVVGGYGSVVTPQFGSNNQLTGQYILQLGALTCLQVFDAGLNYWRNVNVAPQALVTVSSDGQNYRIANTTGCPIGALITAAGSSGTNGFFGYTNSFNNQGTAVNIISGTVTAGNAIFTITPSAGSSTWNAIVGGAINTSLSVSGTVYNGNYGVNNTFGASSGGVTASGGASYTYAPLVVFTPPPNQGAQPYILPAATASISAGAVSAITVTQQGAGLLGLPGITIIPRPGDTTGGGAIVGWSSSNNSMVGSGTMLAMWPAYYGTAVTAVPTFTFAGTSNPAPTVTAIMNFTVTSITNTTAGVGYTNAYAVWQGGTVAGSAANTNPLLDKMLSTVPIFPTLSVTAGTGVTTLAGGFGGVNIQAVPTLAFGTQLAAGTVTTVAVQTPVVGGASDTILLYSI